MKKNILKNCSQQESMDIEKDRSHHDQQNTNLKEITEEEMNNLKVVFKRIDEYFLSEQEVGQNILGLFEKFKEINLKEALKDRKKREIYDEKMEKTYQTLMGVPAYLGVLFTQNTNHFIVNINNQSNNMAQVPNEILQMMQKRKEFMGRLENVRGKHEQEENWLHESEKEILFLTSLYNKIRKQFFCQLAQIVDS